MGLKGVPRLEQPAGEREAGLAEGLLLGQPLGVAVPVSLEMGPACLTALAVEMVIGPPAVRAHDPGEAADQLIEPVAVAVLCDPEDRRLGRGRGPQRAPLARRAPAGLIDVQRRRFQHRGEQRLVWLGQDLRRALADLIDRPGRHADPEQVTGKL